MADDGDGCGTKDEMVALWEWGLSDADTYLQLVDDYFNNPDLNDDDLMTWSELNKWLDMNSEVVGGKAIGKAEGDAMKAFFKSFDRAGD